MWYPSLPWVNFSHVSKQRNWPGHPIFANPEFQSKRKICTTLFGAGYTKYQPEMICVDLFRAKNMFLWQTTSKAPEHQSVA